MDKLLALLEEIKCGVDYVVCDELIDGGIFDSFEIIQAISEIEEKFDVSITPDEITPDNFNSANAMWDMINRLKH